MEGMPNIKNEISTDEAQAYIMGKLNEMRAMGRIDSEPTAVQDILEKLHSKETNPKDAMSKVDAIINSRQDYN